MNAFYSKNPIVDLAFNSETREDIRPLFAATSGRLRIGKRQRVLCLGYLLVLLLATGCKQETLFKSNFDANVVNQPPAQAQAIGTVNVDGPPGSVLVVAAPPSLSGKWIQISRPNGPNLCGLQGNLIQVPRDGTYVFSTVLFIPAGTGLASVQFEPVGTPVTNYFNGFLHLDFMQDNRVRIDDDDSTKFGTFPRGQPFIVQVTLNINASSPSAHIILSGAGASGDANRNIIPALRPKAQQFGAVRLWMGFPFTGPYDATNIVVTRNT